MKKRQKAVLSALVFSAAMNLNGCVYGPPPEEVYNSSEPAVSYQAGESAENNAENAEVQAVPTDGQDKPQ